MRIGGAVLFQGGLTEHVRDMLEILNQVPEIVSIGLVPNFDLTPGRTPPPEHL